MGLLQKLRVNCFKWKKFVPTFDEEFIKNYYEDSNILEVDVEYPKDLHNLHSDLPFLSERMKVKKYISLYAICMIKNNMLFMQELQTSIESCTDIKKLNNQEAWLKPYIEINAKLRTEAENDF